MGARTAWPAIVVLGVLAGLGAVALAGVARSGPRPIDGDAATSRPARSEVLEVLHGWDRSRARAWAEGDPVAVRRLYVAGSAAGRADQRLLRRYVARGLVVRRMATQVLAVRVLASDAQRIRVQVTDRLSEAVAVAGRRQIRLPGDAASTRLLVLERRDGTWRVASVRPMVPGERLVNGRLRVRS